MSERTYIRGLCPSCRTEQKLYIHSNAVSQYSSQYFWLACPFCEWTQNEYHLDADAAVQAYEDIPPAPRPATDYLKIARQADSNDYYEDASAYAAIAQAQALIRIAECLEKIVDDMAQTKRTLEEWEGEL